MKNYHVIVEFCMQWNYAPKAASFAEELFNHFYRDIQKLELIPSSGGAFEVTVNGEKIFSKLDTGIFPVTAEIIDIISTK
jgi:selenoprotein W-related protein